jgi:hypothetical protein
MRLLEQRGCEQERVPPVPLSEASHEQARFQVQREITFLVSIEPDTRRQNVEVRE